MSENVDADAIRFCIYLTIINVIVSLSYLVAHSQSYPGSPTDVTDSLNQSDQTTLWLKAA